MKGIPFSTLHAHELHKVPSEYDEKPVVTIENPLQKLLNLGLLFASRMVATNFDFAEHYYRLPLKILGAFTFDELCKMHYSSPVTMEQSVDTLFKESPEHQLMFKIGNSMWRWGYGECGWNELVDIYHSLRSFVLTEDPDFELRLDYTTGCNEFGYSKFSRTYIDGVFAYLVYYKGKHVMTIGFTILEDRRILIQQIQSAQRHGNRYLFKLPRNRVELVINCFLHHFPTHKVFLIDGKTLVKKTIADYQHALQRTNKSRKFYRKPENNESLQRLERQIKGLQEQIKHVKDDAERLIAFYNETGRYKFRKSTFKRYGLVHRAIAKPVLRPKKGIPLIDTATPKIR
jgi:hypothetical protein